jgi:hypothetical protein
MPEVLPDGLPERASASRFDFSQWADGQAWKFVRGEDYSTATETFRYNVKRWARKHGYEVQTRPLPALDEHGRPLAAAKAEPVALAVRFSRAAGRARRRSRSATTNGPSGTPADGAASDRAENPRTTAADAPAGVRADGSGAARRSGGPDPRAE